MELIRSTLSEERELHCPGQSNGSTQQGLFASWRVRLERKGLGTYYGVYTVALVCTLVMLVLLLVDGDDGDLETSATQDDAPCRRDG